MRRHRRSRSFVLLEVMLSLVILSVTLVGVMRGFVMGLNGIRETKINLQAIQLAESMLADFELEPPASDSDEGNFADDPRYGEAFENFRWEYRVEELDQRYRGETRDIDRDLEPLMLLELSIIYDNPDQRREFVPVRVETYLPELQIFSRDAIERNQLF
jgi:hypothetical protein